MPHEPLPRGIVSRIQKWLTRQSKRKGPDKVYESVGNMRSLDARREVGKDTTLFGGRIREANLARNYPAGVVIKRMHNHMRMKEEYGKDIMSAKEQLEAIRTKVDEHNKLFSKEEDYVLSPPHAYPLEIPGVNDLILMAKADLPTLEEIVDANKRTRRGEKMIRNCRKRDIGIRDMNRISIKLKRRTGIEARNAIVTGFDGSGRLRVVPLLDLH